MKPWQIALALLLALAAVVAAAVYAWVGMGEVEMSWLGVLAMVGGAVVTLALGIGLMALTFYSSRSGHDDEAGR